MLDVENLEKSYGGIRAVAGVSFHVAPGEVLAIIGPNGAGKSTCFGMVGGQVRPDRGRIRLDGADITGASPQTIWRQRVGRTFQVTALFTSMTAAENVQTALTARAGDTWRFLRPARRLHRPAALALLAEVGLAAQADAAAGELAYGDAKRLELAIALAAAPRLLLMDEPTAGMAAAERTTLMALVRHLATTRHLAVLFTEHDPEVVFATADRVLVLHAGAALATGTPAAIRENPTVRAVYLGGD